MRLLFVNCLFFFFILLGFSQELPPISVYSSRDYNAENQNWSLSQDKDKHIYVANNKGLLEFDGAVWRLYPTPNETIIRSVKVIGDKIFTGFYSGFGFWKKNSLGVLEFTSLSKSIDLLVDEQFWKIDEIEGWVVFQSLQRIYLYNETSKQFKVIETKNQILKLFVVNNVLFYQEAGKGIYKLEKGKPSLVSNNKVFLNNIVVGIHLINDNEVYVTDKKGLFIIKEQQVLEWNIDLNKKLSNNTFYSSLKTSDNKLILGTIASGVIVINKNAHVLNTINQIKGLSNNTVLSLLEDKDQNIWLGLDDGINVLHINSPFKVYKDLNGVIGTVYKSVVYNNELYIGTNQGLFKKNNNSVGKFTLIKNTQGQVWELKVIDNQLLCGHNSGTYLIKNGKAKLISSFMGTWKITQLTPNKFIQGNYTGLYVFEKQKGDWKFKNKISGFNISSRYFELLDKNTIFINHEYKGVYKLKVNNDLTKVINVSKMGTVPKGIHSALLKYKGDIIYSYKKGVYKYNKKQDKFIINKSLSNYSKEEDYVSGVMVYMKDRNKLWGFSGKEIVCLEEGGISSKPIISRISIPLKLRKGATGFENIINFSGETYLLGNSNGYIKLNLKKLNKQRKFKVKINQILNTSVDNKTVNVDLNSKGSFHSSSNNLAMYCSVPIFNNYAQAQYQYRLNGFNNLWSDWSNESVINLNNLSFGNYVLEIRASIDGVITSNVAVYKFKIQKPWYISTYLIVVYVIIIILFSVFMHSMYNRKYLKEKKKLLEKKQRALELQKLENDKRLAILENEKLEADVDLKSKELAGSTMNIIKKNELLNNIKDELLKGNQKNIDNVINIIDKNLNDVDDWKLFEEAFNNADKDFIKKMKSIHLTLTSNDLRLCAYLRLNLSSKEIAPLLNISPKSVEVKRYRLRKKMNLSTEQNLTDYILSM